MDKWIPIFKTGFHMDANGNARQWTEADLDKIAAYDPAMHEAPVVIGHPRDNAPAYGWVGEVKREGHMLYYKETKTQPEFDAMRKRGLFKKRSISLYPDGSLRHVGYLGAMPPAIKGLPDVTFKENKDDRSYMTYMTHEEKEEKSMKFFDWLKGQAAKEGVTLEDVPQSFSEADVQARVDAAVKEKTKEIEEQKRKEFSEKLTDHITAREEGLKTREDALRQKEADAKKQAVASFCEDLKQKGVLTPAMEKLGMGITEFMQQVGSIETTVEFSEGETRKNQTPLEFMQAFLGSLPKSIEFGEVAGRDKDAGKGNAEKREKLISSFMEQHKDKTYRDAFKAVASEHPELFETE